MKIPIVSRAMAIEDDAEHALLNVARLQGLLRCAAEIVEARASGTCARAQGASLTHVTGALQGELEWCEELHRLYQGGDL
jgi:hypothetical protein